MHTVTELDCTRIVLSQNPEDCIGLNEHHEMVGFAIPDAFFPNANTDFFLVTSNGVTSEDF